MKQAYDLKTLGSMIVSMGKQDGLNLTEEALEKLGKTVYLATKQWLKESAALSETKIDDLIAPYLDHADSFVLPQIEKIDVNGDGR